MGVGGGILVSEWMCGGAHWLVNGCVWGGAHWLVNACAFHFWTDVRI